MSNFYMKLHTSSYFVNTPTAEVLEILLVR